MLVNNAIIIIFVVITGIALVQCGTSIGKLRPKLKKEGSRHKSNNDDILARSLSDFGVVRRSLNPMTYQQYSSFQYLEEEETVSTGENKKNVVIEKLKLSVTFRDNILYVFSYLLHGSENDLMEDQYTALQTLYVFLKKKMVYMYNLLSILPKLDTPDKNQQTSVILSSLIPNLPAYTQCTAKYLLNEIDLKRVDFNALLKPTEFETFNYLANIDINTISITKIKNEEMMGYDRNSNITQTAVGPVFVKILYNLQVKKLSLSQEQFGLIVINLPNPSEDPVLEENVRFIYDLTKNSVIERNSWNSIVREAPVEKDAYTLVFFILTKILNSNLEVTIKDATAYVYHHLKIVTVPTHINSNFKYMQHLIEKDLDIGMLLSAVTPQEFDQDAVRMKDQLLTYFMRNYRNEDINKILKGFNKFAYNDPLDLLLAFLTRLTNRVSSNPNTNSVLHNSATVLLSAVIMERYSRFFMPFVSPEIDVLILLDSLKIPNIEPALQSTIDSIKLELIAQPQISVLLSTLIPTEKEKCTIPKQCLVNTFQQIQKIQNNIPMTLTTKIQNVVYMLKQTQTTQQQKTQYTIKPVDVNVYVDRENQVGMAVGTDNTYIGNVPSNFNKVSYGYVWNIDKYVGKAGLAVQGVSKGRTSEIWETRIPTYVDSRETKVVSPTTIKQAPVTETLVTKRKLTKETTKGIEPKVTQTPVTEYVPIRGSTSVRPITLKPLLTTSVPNVPILINTYKPTQKPQTWQPHYTTESTVEEHTTEINYSSEHTTDPQLIIYEVSRRPSTSEEIEEVSFVEEMVKITTKKPIEMTTHKPKLLQKVEEKMNNESVSNAVVLPPSIKTDRPLRVLLSKTGVLVVTTGNNYNATEPEIVLPEVKKLLKPPDINELMRETKSTIVKQVLQPLSAIFGKNVKKILKNVDVKRIPTNIALLSTILKKAITYPEVIKNTELTTTIYKYISTIEYVSPTILLPIIVSSKKLVTNVVYSTFSPNNFTYSIIGENPPSKQLTVESVTIPLVNPKLLLQSVKPSNPYIDLLPTLEKGNPFAAVVQSLKMIFKSSKIMEILGPDFQPLLYPNKGALLITLLYKLKESKMIQSNPKLKYSVEIYIQAIEIPSMTIQVSEDRLVKMMSETTGQWQPELTSLMYALPIIQNDAEIIMQKTLNQFLDDLTLLDRLNIPMPPSTMTRGELLQKIIASSVYGNINLEDSLMVALRYYEHKVQFTGDGALPIIWMWVETYVVKTEVNLGTMIQETVDFDELTYKEKLAYNELITYLAQNPSLLQDNDDFNFEQYKTQGKFIQGLFKHLLKKPEITTKIKKDIVIILPRVKQDGAGAILMPTYSEF
ncbi:uncharacterized protein LOC113003947 [Solenopsis invicta]|uniref:uncharacterized protein LOC113003947 n=1 Tax=Solenopsis invicta TaxID=13686 RepID=UPI00193CAD6E|nr:uncharacterized protein LOC113003947 [Solenopsis invicta]